MALTSIQPPIKNTAIFLFNRGNTGGATAIISKPKNEATLPEKKNTYSRTRVVNK